MGIEEISTEKLLELKRTPKRITNPQAKRRPEERHERVDYEAIADANECRFWVYLRQNTMDAEDFSCGIRWLMPSGETLTLARYNGSSHRHGDIEFRCHIHQTTEEAIRSGKKPEHHAEATDRFRTLGGALDCLLKDFNISGLDSQPDQLELFG